ncbi:X-Pro dipeptidyl-peptidase protein [Zopfia rhizophila CBS 207.26]|uniref:X-Pro dipeptidyl-peptidase protein n=1 Tax=Zopfia rhizophila CBS 207.26 TaxID=1314779 RepID=A0A6A6EIV1_9PEZI|nr:X-Pro dipeptidyl-peptidase protein [Zopfia rhizophila CBS 207.26]
MSNKIKDLHTIDDTSFPYTFEQNASVPLKTSEGLVRCNVYRKIPSKLNQRYPVLVTYDFHPKSFSEVNAEHHSAHSAWETPDPGFWAQVDYAIVRADERGLGQSPGLLNTISRGTSEAFFDIVEWATEQPWSSGKVGLLGISYYADSQWRVAARKPKGLTCMIPWEGMSDYYRDRCRHGGILSNKFIKFWWDRQVVSNQYGRPGRKEKNWYRFRDEEYYASKEYDMGDFEVPLLSVGNWGGILLHLRGNIEGYTHAGSEFKYLRMITGRHDLPSYYKHEVEIQRSFLDAFLKGEDRPGWSEKGKLPPADLVLRKGDVGFNDAEKEKSYPRRTKNEWPIARTQYTKYYLTPSQILTIVEPEEIEITGHIVAHLNVSLSIDPTGLTPSDIDIFLTLRYVSPSGKEVFYTDTAGDLVPLTKGWLRVNLRKTNPEHPKHRQWLPWRDYFSTDVLPNFWFTWLMDTLVLPVVLGNVYAVDVEIWPTNVVVEKGGRIVLEVSSGDTQGSGIFLHDYPDDRSEAKLRGMNHIHFGPRFLNWVSPPIIPPK